MYYIVQENVFRESHYNNLIEVMDRMCLEYKVVRIFPFVDKYQLAEAFVIDVCLSEHGWKIVECGCINCAGFYCSDLQKTLTALEDFYDPSKISN